MCKRIHFLSSTLLRFFFFNIFSAPPSLFRPRSKDRDGQVEGGGDVEKTPTARPGLRSGPGRHRPGEENLRPRARQDIGWGRGLGLLADREMWSDTLCCI